MKTLLDIFKEDLALRIKKEKKSIRSLAAELGIDSSSLSFFLSGARKGLHGENILKLLPFIYEPLKIKHQSLEKEQAKDEINNKGNKVKAKTPRTRKRSCRFTEEELAEMDEKAKDIVL